MLSDILDFSRVKINEFIVRETARIKTGALILDAGAGDPVFQNHDPRLKYVTYDMAVGQEDWDYSGLDAIGSLEAAAFKSESFDAILCTQVLEHVPEPEIVLKELFRVLRVDGTLLLTAPQEWYLHQPPHDYYRYTKYGLEYVLGKAGFTVEKIEPLGGYFLLMSHRIGLFHRFFFPPVENIFLRIIRKPLKSFAMWFFGRFLPKVLLRLEKHDTTQTVTCGYTVVCTKTPPMNTKR